MKVLLVRPKVPNLFKHVNLITCEPLELEYLSTALVDRAHEVLIFDGVFDRKPFQKVLKAFDPDLVAITGYITQEKLMKSYALMAKKHNSNSITLVGGVHAQLNFHRFRVAEIDYIFRSESMEDFGILVDSLQSGKETLGSINGLVYHSEQQWIENALDPVDINKLPIPDRSYFHAHKNRYHYLDLNAVATIKTSFSCGHSCNFCYCTKLGGGFYRARNMDLVLEELIAIDTDNILIVDDDFLADIGRVKSFVDGVEKAGLKKNYICYARADAVASNPELIDKMTQVGFRYFIVGLEAVSDDDLVNYNKMTTEAINRQCIENIQKANAQVIALMMISHKATKKTFQAIYNWAKINKLPYTTVSIFTPIPGTNLYETYKDQLVNEKIEHWDFLHLVLAPLNMTKFQFYYHFINLSFSLYRLGKKNGGTYVQTQNESKRRKRT